MKDNAIGLYKSRNLERDLVGCSILKTLHDDKYNCDVVVFINNYRNVCYDLFVTKKGLLVSNAYGADMDRNKLDFIAFGAWGI